MHFYLGCVKRLERVVNLEKRSYNRILFWGMNMKFDVIIMNAPYQAPQTQRIKGSKKRSRGTSLWEKFLAKAISLLKDGGYLCNIHPSGWRAPESTYHKGEVDGVPFNLRNILYKYQLHSLVIRNSKEGNRVFGAGTRFDYYVLEKVPAYKPTLVSFQDMEYNEFIEIDLRGVDFIPNSNPDDFWRKHWNGRGVDRYLDVKVTYTTDTRRDYIQEEKTLLFKYPLVHATNKNGIRLFYSSKPCENQDKKKVIFGDGSLNPFYDKGEYGTTSHGLWIEVESREEGEKLIRYLKSDLVSKLIDSLQWGNFQLTPKMFSCIPYPEGEVE